jgi:hypothetical protein
MFNHPPAYEPRASRIPIPGRGDLTTELWMGGANSLHGDLLVPAELCDAWLIDLAGEMPEEHRLACACWLPRVFADVEAIPQRYDRLDALARSVAACISGERQRDSWPHPAEPPRRVFVMCQQGMNRSGLVTGLILRALGVSTADTLAAIASRPGALTNQTYLRLLHEWADVYAI